MPAGSGHWEGSIRLPKKTLAVAVDLTRSAQGWAGSLTFPGLAFSPIPLAGISVSNGSASFLSQESLLKIDATLSADQQSMEGTLISGFLLTVPVAVELRRSGEPRMSASVSNGQITGDIEGVWEGTITPKPSWEPDDPRIGPPVQVRLRFSRGRDGVASGSFSSNGAAGIALSAIRQQGSSLRFDVQGAGAVFDGHLDGEELIGEWVQFDADSIQVAFHRAEPN